MKLTKQHFRMIAKVIREARKQGLSRDQICLSAIAVRFADELKHYNPTFNERAFLNACSNKAEDDGVDYEQYPLKSA